LYAGFFVIRRWLEVGVRGELQPGDPFRIGPYRLAEVLASGGMGRVYLARSPGGRPVAVKAIRAELAADAEFRARFRREVAAARRVNGLYTAVVVDADTDGLVPWLATAHVDGPSLADAVRDGGPLSGSSLLGLAAGLAEGLAAIHAVGLVHRDLKPSNVLLAGDGPRIIDFGIAWSAELSSLTGTDALVGSPGYMSPEQAEPGGEVGPASDVFTLSALLRRDRPWPVGDGFRVRAHLPRGPSGTRPRRCARRDPRSHRAVPGQGSHSGRPRRRSCRNSATLTRTTRSARARRVPPVPGPRSSRTSGREPRSSRARCPRLRQGSNPAKT
jgi:serine/threonine protein kinase